MSENFEDKVDIKENYGVAVNLGNISNSTFAKTIINDTKNVSWKGEPAEFPNNLNILRTGAVKFVGRDKDCLLYTSPSPRDISGSRMPSSA